VEKFINLICFIEFLTGNNIKKPNNKNKKNKNKKKKKETTSKKRNEIKM
jgi:hypothetical protein